MKVHCSTGSNFQFPLLFSYKTKICTTPQQLKVVFFLLGPNNITNHSRVVTATRVLLWEAPMKNQPQKNMNINEPRRSKRRPLENAKPFFIFLASAETRAACRCCQESVQAALIVNAGLKAARKVLCRVRLDKTICDLTPSQKPPLRRLLFGFNCPAAASKQVSQVEWIIFMCTQRRNNCVKMASG